jgi:hypothetical protein
LSGFPKERDSNLFSFFFSKTDSIHGVLDSVKLILLLTGVNENSCLISHLFHDSRKRSVPDAATKILLTEIFMKIAAVKGIFFLGTFVVFPSILKKKIIIVLNSATFLRGEVLEDDEAVGLEHL